MRFSFLLALFLFFLLQFYLRYHLDLRDLPTFALKNSNFSKAGYLFADFLCQHVLELMNSQNVGQQSADFFKISLNVDNLLMFIFSRRMTHVFYLIHYSSYAGAEAAAAQAESMAVVLDTKINRSVFQLSLNDIFGPGCFSWP